MRWLTSTLVVIGAAALVGFAGAAQASATIDLIWIDTTDPACIDAARRDCPRFGATISSVAATDNITLAVIVTAGPKGLQGASVGVDYRNIGQGADHHRVHAVPAPDLDRHHRVE